MDQLTRRRLLGTSMMGMGAANAMLCGSSSAAESKFKSKLFGQATPTADGFDGVALQVVAADDFSPVEGVWVSVTCIGYSISETRTSALQTNADGFVTFNLRHEIPGPYIVDLRPPEKSRFCRTSFHVPESMLTIQKNGHYYPQVLRIAFRETKWNEMQGLGPGKKCE